MIFSTTSTITRRDGVDLPGFNPCRKHGQTPQAHIVYTGRRPRPRGVQVACSCCVAADPEDFVFAGQGDAVAKWNRFNSVA